MSDRRRVNIPFLFNGFEGQVVVPLDITVAEAERLVAMIRTLPIGMEGNDE